MSLGSGGIFSGGTNYEVELGYNFMVTSTVYLGLSVVYESFTWNTSDSSGTSTGQTNSQANLYPALGIGVVF